MSPLNSGKFTKKNTLTALLEKTHRSVELPKIFPLNAEDMSSL
jgi:hypothetical protein